MGSGGKKSRRKVRSTIDQMELDDVEFTTRRTETPDDGGEYKPMPEHPKTTQARTMAEILRDEHRVKLAAKAKREAAEAAVRAATEVGHAPPP
jgi:hypothetical protein